MVLNALNLADYYVIERQFLEGWFTGKIKF